MPIRDAYEPGRPCWVDLGTTDPEAARAFYTEMFGWSAEVDPRPEAGGYAQFLHDGHEVAGVGPIFAEGMPPSWTTYIATADADATAKDITANGGTLLQPPFDVLDAGRMAVFAGPDGAVAGIWQAGKHTGAQFVTEVGGWNWSQLLTRDKEAALAFYGAVFDWRLGEDPNWGEYIALGDNGEIAGATQMGDEFPSDVPAHWEVSFLVPDADAFLERAQSLGAKQLGPSQDTPMNGRSASLADPQGAAFIVMSFPAQPG
jgi:predicted enzyme related to lactoylglutathione lyase